VSTVLRYPGVTITAFVPLGDASFPGTLLDLNAKRFWQVLPDRAIVADGGRTRAFVGIDKRPGTPLDCWIQRIASQVPKSDPEAALEYLRLNATRILRLTKGAATNDQAAELPWDKTVEKNEDDMKTFESAADLELGAVPLATGSERPVVPLERYLDWGAGYCLQRSLIINMVLDRIGIQSRVVAGGIVTGSDASSGHTWLELADGRVFDPSWGLIERPGPKDPNPPNAFKFGDSNRFENQWFVYIRN
jgi:hypothetical protein